MHSVDVVVVGSGPNGLAAAVTMARAGLHVQLYERSETLGGGARTAELTLPGFLHDVCSAVHPLAFSSEFFRKFELAKRVKFYQPTVAFGHPLEGGHAGLAYRSLEETVSALGGSGGKAWSRLFSPLVTKSEQLAELTSSSLLRFPRDPLLALRCALRIAEQGTPLGAMNFRGSEAAAALFSGVAAHAILRMPSFASAAAGIVLATQAHSVGWPIPHGGSQSIVAALRDDLLANGGEIFTGTAITSLKEIPPHRALFLDLSPRAFLALAGKQLPERYARSLRNFRYGNAAAKVDFALSEPVPWANPELAKAGTVHVGGTREEIIRAENAVASGKHADSPYVLLSQPSIFDASRAPLGSHVLWAYTHVPRNSSVDQRQKIIAQIERFAPGFTDTIMAVSSKTAVDLETYNPNYVGGDISVGEASMRQLLRRPVFSTQPWKTPLQGVYLCSSATPPGPGVHGLCGWNAARRALLAEFGITTEPQLGLAV